MSLKTTLLITYLSILIPIVIAITTLKKANKRYYPFFFFLFSILVFNLFYSIMLGFFALKQSQGLVNIIGNIHALTEMVMLTWIFKQWALFGNGKKFYNPFIIVSILVGLLEWNYCGFFSYIRYFDIFIRISGTLFSIIMINDFVRSSNEPLLKKPAFLICLGLIVYYLIDLTSSIFFYNVFTASKAFQTELSKITTASAVIAHLIFAYALVLMAKQNQHSNFKEAFTLPLNGAEISSPQKTLV